MHALVGTTAGFILTYCTALLVVAGVDAFAQSELVASALTICFLYTFFACHEALRSYLHDGILYGIGSMFVIVSFGGWAMIL